MSEWPPSTVSSSSPPTASAIPTSSPPTSAFHLLASPTSTNDVHTTYSNAAAMSNLLQQIAASTTTSCTTPSAPLTALPQQQLQQSTNSLIEQFLASTASSSSFVVPVVQQPDPIPTTLPEACFSGENLQMLATLAALRVKNNQEQQMLASLDVSNPLAPGPVQLETPNPLAQLEAPNPLVQQLSTPVTTPTATLESLLFLLAATQQAPVTSQPLLSPTAGLLNATTPGSAPPKPTIITTVVPPIQSAPQVIKRGRPKRSVDMIPTTYTAAALPKPPKVEAPKPDIKSIVRPVQTSGRIPTSADSCSAIANYLMSYNKSPDGEFSRKAIESLIKKLKDRHAELDTLIQAVQSDGQEVGVCITIPRTLDGRLQVSVFIV